MTVQEVFASLNRLAPVETALDFDNVGLLVGSKDVEVSQILVALDITDEVVEEAVRTKSNLIVAHHPIIFSPLPAVEAESIVGRLLQNGISAICMHTNLDAAKGGVNDALATLLGLSEVTVPEEDPLMRIGTVPTCDLQDFLKQVCAKLGLPTVKYRGTDKVSKVGLCGGSACEGAALAYSLGCDTYITGEVKHHIWLEPGRNLIEAGHFATENPVCETLVSYLMQEFSQVSVSIAESNRDPASYFIRKE
ncbi:MAG: Nif3-like dinuclear metal center hexameric protein [Oscillospiraceae bacterium]|nr:Nif3-like dinuclear metal center hexameric protein [Oscillospiraceae bacterium]